MIIRKGEKLLGKTPVIKLNKVVPAGGPQIFLKLEQFNPAGSVKDRPAMEMLKQAEKDGHLPRGGGGTILEATSGNTGIGLARAAVLLGHRCIIVLPEDASQERRQLMTAYGAELILSPAADGMKGAYNLCLELQDKYPSAFRPDQFANPANPAAHEKTTGPEILEAFQQDLAVLIVSCGTGGTITGTGNFLKERIPGLEIATFESRCSPVLSGGEPGSHNIPGTGPGFIPEILDKKIYDRIILLEDEEVYELQEQLSKKEGLFLGPSSAAGVLTGLKIAGEYGEYQPEDNFLIIAPDSGERYLSSLFPEN